MKKFTAFTVMLTVVTVVAVSDVLMNDYLPGETDSSNSSVFKLPEGLDLSDTFVTNVLGVEKVQEEEAEVVEEGKMPIPRKLPENEENTETVTETEELPVVEDPNEEPEDFEVAVNELPEIDDFENVGANQVQVVDKNVLIREDQLRPAGYLDSYLAEENFMGKIFKSIDLSEFKDLEIRQSVIRTNSALLTRVYVVKAGINGNINDIYEVMKVRANALGNVNVNETNEFGLKSFYMNDSLRGNTAFLTVRIGGNVYSFSYPKDYHAQVTNLIQLLVWEFS